MKAGIGDSNPLRIMLIEDDVVDARLVYRELANRRDNGRPVQLIHVGRLSTALEQLESNDEGIDLILVDLGLPDATFTIEAVARLRVARPDIPLIVLSGQEFESVGTSAFEEGASYFLPKSVAAGSIWKVVKSTLARTRPYLNLREMVQSSEDGMLVINSRREILFANPAAERMLQLDEGDERVRRFKLPITPHRVEVRIADDGIAEMQFTEVTWNAEAALLVTLRDLTDRYGLDPSAFENRDEGTTARTSDR